MNKVRGKEEARASLPADLRALTSHLESMAVEVGQ